MMLRDGCLSCYPDGIPTAHDGPHLVTPVWGGRASCPLDEADDTGLMVECLWVSLEEAMTDAGWDLPEHAREAALLANWLREQPAWYQPDFAGLPGLHVDGYAIRWETRTDEHLEEASGTLDVICTITAPPTLIAA